MHCHNGVVPSSLSLHLQLKFVGHFRQDFTTAGWLAGCCALVWVAVRPNTRLAQPPLLTGPPPACAPSCRASVCNLGVKQSNTLPLHQPHSSRRYHCPQSARNHRAADNVAAPLPPSTLTPSHPPLHKVSPPPLGRLDEANILQVCRSLGEAGSQLTLQHRRRIAGGAAAPARCALLAVCSCPSLAFALAFALAALCRCPAPLAGGVRAGSIDCCISFVPVCQVGAGGVLLEGGRRHRRRLQLGIGGGSVCQVGSLTLKRHRSASRPNR